MSIEQYSYLEIYLAGCVLAFILSIIKISTYKIIPWVARDGIAITNMKKILPPAEKNTVRKVVSLAFLYVGEVATSWVNVVVYSWQIIVVVLKSISERRALKRAPAEIQRLRRPLRNDAGMSREAVWAYMITIRVMLSEISPDGAELVSALDELSEYYPEMNQKDALHRLTELDVLDSAVMNSDAILAVMNS